MTPDVILIAAGCGLLLIGLLGGGITSKWVNVGIVAGTARFLTGLCGIVFVVVGVVIKVNPQSLVPTVKSAATRDQASPQAQSPDLSALPVPVPTEVAPEETNPVTDPKKTIKVYIVCGTYGGAVDLTFLFDDKVEAQCATKGSMDFIRITVYLSRAGSHHYTATGAERFVNLGAPAVRLIGQGDIEITPDSEFNTSVEYLKNRISLYDTKSLKTWR